MGIASGGNARQAPISRYGEEIALLDKYYGKVAFYDDFADAATAIKWQKYNYVKVGAGDALAATTAGTAPSGTIYGCKATCGNTANDNTCGYVNLPLPAAAKKIYAYTCLNDFAASSKPYVDITTYDGTTKYQYMVFFDITNGDLSYISDSNALETGTVVDIDTSVQSPVGTGWKYFNMVVDLENHKIESVDWLGEQYSVNGTITGQASATTWTNYIEVGVKTEAAASKSISWGNFLARWE